NRVDGGASRDLYFEVAVTDTYNRTGLPATLIAYNDPIPAPVVSVKGGVEQIHISWSPTDAEDYVKTKVWVSKTSGIDTTQPATVESMGGMYTHAVDEIVEHYVKVAHIDSFSETDFTASSEFEVLPYAAVIDTEPPAVPTGLTLSS